MAGVSGPIALETGAGASGGIGFDIARALVKRGARVRLTDLASSAGMAQTGTGAMLVVDGGDTLQEGMGCRSSALAGVLAVLVHIPGARGVDGLQDNRSFAPGSAKMPGTWQLSGPHERPV